MNSLGSAFPLCSSYHHQLSWPTASTHNTTLTWASCMQYYVRTITLFSNFNCNHNGTAENVTTTMSPTPFPLWHRLHVLADMIHYLHYHLTLKESSVDRTPLEFPLCSSPQYQLTWPPASTHNTTLTWASCMQHYVRTIPLFSNFNCNHDGSAENITTTRSHARFPLWHRLHVLADKIHYHLTLKESSVDRTPLEFPLCSSPHYQLLWPPASTHRMCQHVRYTWLRPYILLTYGRMVCLPSRRELL